VPKLDWRELTAIFAGGFLGAPARVLLVQAAPAAAGAWPWPTFAANVAGTLLLGYFATRLQERLPVSAYRRPLLGTGLCGAFTTFSTMQLEVLRMVTDGHAGLAVAYVLASVTVGLLSVFLATALVRRTRTLQ
jgi:CrcB protein